MGVAGVELDLLDVPLQPVVELVQAHPPGVAAGVGSGSVGG